VAEQVGEERKNKVVAEVKLKNALVMGYGVGDDWEGGWGEKMERRTGRKGERGNKRESLYKGGGGQRCSVVPKTVSPLNRKKKRTEKKKGVSSP